MKQYRPVIYMILSAICFTAVNSSVRYVDHLPTFEILFFRAIGSVLLCLLILKQQRLNILGHNRKWLVIRALVGFTSISLFFRAMQMMPLGSAVSLRYLSPFFASAIAIWFLREKMKRIQWLFFIMAFAGVLILKGFDTRITIIGLVIILSSAFFSGWVYLSIRMIGRSEHPVVIMNYFLSLTCVVSGVISLFYWTDPMGLEWLVLLGMGIFGFFAQLFMTMAMQISEANQITPLKYIEVIFTVLAAWIIFGETHSWLAVIAMGIIVVSLFGNMWVKNRRQNIKM